MIRKEAISIIIKEIENNPVVAANGYISRDLFEICDRNENFYMIGSMGLASSIALGIALKNSKQRIFVFDGDGNILMNLGSLTTIGSLRPKNLVHVIFDNHSHESTGGQPTNSKKIELGKIGESTTFKVLTASSKTNLISCLKKIKRIQGPLMLIIKVHNSKNVSTSVELEPKLIKERFMKSLQLLK